MRRLIGKLKKVLHPTVFVILSLVIFGFVVFYFGQRLGMRGIYPLRTEGVRFWVAFLLWTGAFLFASYHLIRFIWRKISARKKAEPVPPTREELEVDAMAKIFKSVSRLIKQRWEGSGPAIYGLPWYLVIGKMNAGKTALIENTDLSFPIDHEVASIIEPYAEYEAARFVDWKISSNEAVILDLQGENFVPHQERKPLQTLLWQQFLKNLSRVRPRRPLNGVVIALDVDEFSQLSLDEREEYAIEIRRTISDLIEYLGTKLTVYVVFTKLDLLAGFKDYFSRLNAQEREELMGFHFDFRVGTDQDWQSQFEAQYAAFLDLIRERLPLDLIDMNTPSTRRDAYVFYRTLFGMETPIRKFMSTMLAGDKFSTPPLVRGVYLTSVRQENVPESIFLDSIGQRFRLPPPLYGTSQGKSVPYFVTNFFKKSVFPEAGLAGANLRVERLNRNRGLIAGGLASLLTVGIIGFWATQYRENLHNAELVEEKAKEFAAIDLSKVNSDSAQDFLPPLNTIRDASLVFENYREKNALVSRATLYQGKRLGPIADAAYLDALNGHLMQSLTNEVAVELRDICPKGTDSELDLLRVYRMLGELSGRDNRVIAKYFSDKWQGSFEANAEIQNDLNGHLNYALDYAPYAYDVNPTLIASSQANLLQVTPYRRVYSAFRSLADRDLERSKSFQTAAGANFDIVYRSARIEDGTTNEQNTGADRGDCPVIVPQDARMQPFQVAQFFTKEGYLDFFNPKIDEVTTIAADDLWVLGTLENTEYSDEDYEKIRTNVREIYVDEYIQAWRNALNDLRVTDFEDLRDAVEVTRVMGSPDSPIRRLTQLVTDETTIYADNETGVELEGIEAATSELPMNPEIEGGVAIRRAFLDIQNLLEAEQDDQPAKIAEVIAANQAVYEYLKEINEAADPQAKALEKAIERAELKGDDPIYILRRIADQMPPPFDEHLEHIADEAWRIVLVEAATALNRKWQTEVYGQYQRTISGNYPFDAASTNDLPVDDFVDFFKPGGRLDSFYRDELLVFIDEITGEPIPIDGEYLAVSPEFVDELKKAIQITESFFDADGELSVVFNVTPVRMDQNILRAVLNVEGQIVSFAHGPSQTAKIVWPNIVDGPITSRVDMSTLARSGQSDSVSANGPWSWLRLLDKGSRGSVSNNAVEVAFTNRYGQSVTFDFRSESKLNPFTNSPLNGFELPRTLSAQREAPSNE